MRSTNDILEKIIKIAVDDEHILAVCLNGSRADKNAFCDQYSDFDIIYVVEEIRNYTTNQQWFDQFGELLISQTPDVFDGYDFTGNEKFTKLMQFTDGSRIDLTLVDVTNMKFLLESKEPQLVLLNKNKHLELKNIFSCEDYFLNLPQQQEFFECVNEFWWVVPYVAKGLCRQEITYIKHHFEGILHEMLWKMLGWKYSLLYHKQITFGKHYRYLNRYMNTEEQKQFLDTFANGTIDDIWEKLFHICDFFDEQAQIVAVSLLLEYDKKIAGTMKAYLTRIKNDLK